MKRPFLDCLMLPQINVFPEPREHGTKFQLSKPIEKKNYIKVILCRSVEWRRIHYVAFQHENSNFKTTRVGFCDKTTLFGQHSRFQGQRGKHRCWFMPWHKKKQVVLISNPLWRHFLGGCERAQFLGFAVSFFGANHNRLCPVLENLSERPRLPLK